MYTLSLEVVNKCNLNCSYCYLGEKKNTFMSMKTAKAAIEIGVHESQKQYDKILIIYFIGGEPLLAMKVIKEIVNYVKIRCKNVGVKYQFSTTINGTLLTEKIIDFMIENNFELKLSLDGTEEVHNLNRKDYQGNGSYQIIIDKLDYILKYETNVGKKVSYAHVITTNNYKFFGESFQFLLSLGSERIETGIDHYCNWNVEDREGLREKIIEVFALYKNQIITTNKWFYWNMFEINLNAFVMDCDFYSCKAGLNNIFITTNGSIYTCIELPEFEIGNVVKGLNVKRIREIVYAKDMVHDNCIECQYLNCCKTRGCQASNFELYKNIYEPVEVSCMVTKTFYHLFQDNFSKEQLDNMRKTEGEKRNAKKQFS